MMDMVARASALMRLIEAGGSGGADDVLPEAILSCSAGLIDAGSPEVAIELLTASAALSNGPGRYWTLRSELMRARALTLSGRFAESSSILAEATAKHAEILPHHPAEAHLLRAYDAPNLWGLHRADEAVARMLALRAELITQADSHALAFCCYQLASAESTRGHTASAKRFLMEALVSSRRSGSRSVECSALLTLSMIERSACHWQTATEAATEALSLATVDGLDVPRCHAYRSLGVTALKAGRLDDAIHLAGESLSASSGNPRLEVFATLLRVQALTHAGRFEEATPAVSGSTDSAETRTALLAVEYLGDIHLEQGDPAEALRHYDEVWPKAIALVPKGDIVAELRRRRAECQLLLGRHDEAYAEAKAALSHCRELGDRYEEAATYRILASSAAAVGRTAEAKSHFEQGFEFYADIETPYEWGKLWLAYGDWLRGEHAGTFKDASAARDAYHAAAAHFEAMGSKAKFAEALARLHALPSDAGPLSGEAEVDRAIGGPDRGSTRTRRRPRAIGELERRGAWAWDSFRVVTRHRGMLDLLEKVAKLAPSRAAVLVLGESGTGKELIAQGLHRLSSRTGQWMPINCSTLPRDVIESELFGHEAGAFTGAIKGKPGLLEVCGSGTAFLDEIGEMPIELQTRLLRFLELGEFRRLGGTEVVHSDARIVAATNRARPALERGDGLRVDLYYRLAHAVIELPPLRRRGEDVGLLVDHFLADACGVEGKTVTLDAGARARLLEYGWPGNIRQLKTALRRVVLLTGDGGVAGADDLELELADAPATLGQEMAATERRRIEDALASAGGSRTEAARALGMPRTTLLHKMKRLGLAPEE